MLCCAISGKYECFFRCVDIWCTLEARSGRLDLILDGDRYWMWPMRSMGECDTIGMPCAYDGPGCWHKVRVYLFKIHTHISDELNKFSHTEHIL